MPSPYQFVPVGGLEAIMGSVPYDADVNALMRGGASGWNSSIGNDPSNPAFQAAVDAAVASKLAAQGVIVRQQQALVARTYPVGFDSGAAIAANASLTITVQPQVLFRSERFIVPSDIAGQFLINDIKCGKDSMYAATGPVHARTFDERGVDCGLMLATSQVSQQISVNVTNIGGAPQRFFATMLGKAIEQG